jgi:AcrR family transcriptional regulator
MKVKGGPGVGRDAGAKARLPGPERRHQIIEAAADLFARNGFRGTTTREVAAAAGVSEAVVFKHFPTKEELYAAIIEAKARTQEVLGGALAAATREDDAAVLRTLAREMIARMQADPTLMRLLLFSALEGHSLSEIFFRSRVLQVDEFLCGYISQRVAAGAFRPVDPGLAAWNFMGMVVHRILLRELFGQRSPSDATPERAVEEMVSIFLEGVRRA